MAVENKDQPDEKWELEDIDLRLVTALQQWVDKQENPSGLLQWICVGGMRAPEAVEIFRNFRFLEQHRLELEGQYIGQWVASLDGMFYSDPNLNQLINSIETMKPYSHRAYAYIEKCNTPRK